VEQSESSYYETLKKSILTYHDAVDVPVLCQEDNRFIYREFRTEVLTEDQKHIDRNLDAINRHLPCFRTKTGSNSDRLFNTLPEISSSLTNEVNMDGLEAHEQKYRLFVETLIQADPSHRGFIRSCIRGNRNHDLLFFNIGGEYRLCTSQARHHARNTTAVLIDMNNSTFAVCCKDPDCHHTAPVWKKIE